MEPQEPAEHIMMLNIERGHTGRFYITSSLHKGLLVGGRTLEEALIKVPQALVDLTTSEHNDPTVANFKEVK